MANLNEQQLLVVPELEPLNKEPLTVPELKGLGAAQEPEPQRKMIGSDLNVKDIGVGLAGAPSLATSQVLGTPGDVRATSRAVTQWAEQPRITAGTSAGAEEQARRWEQTKKMVPPHAPTLYDLVSPYLFGEKGGAPIFPTSEQWYKSMPSFVKTEPKTPEGQTAQDIAAFGLSTAVGGEGGVPGFIGRTLMGSGVEALGKGLEEWQKGSPYEKYIRPVTELVGTALGHKAVKSMMPGVQAEKQISEALFRDRQNLNEALSQADVDSLGAKFGMTGEQVREALRTGTKLSGIDIGGPEAEILLRESAGLSDSARDALEKYNRTAAGPGKPVPPKLSSAQSSIQNFFSSPEFAGAGAEAKAGAKAGAKATTVAPEAEPEIDLAKAEKIILEKHGQDTLDYQRARGEQSIKDRADTIKYLHDLDNPDSPLDLYVEKPAAVAQAAPTAPVYAPIGDRLALEAAANKADVNRLYDTAMQHPNAASIPASSFSPEVQNSDAFKTAVDQVSKNLEAMKRKYGFENKDVIAPQSGAAAIRDPFTGEVRQAAQPGTQGNLAFYDLVKKQMWNNEKTLEAAGDANAWLIGDTRRAMVNDLDRVTEGAYANARDKFAEGVGMQDAGNAGYEFGRKAGTRSLTSVERNEYNSAINSYSPEQKQIMENGFLTAMIEKTNTPGGINSIAKNLLGNKNFQDDARMILGEEKYHLFRGKMLAENARLAASELAPIQPKGMLGQAVRETAGSAVMVVPFMIDTLTQAIINAQFTPGVGAAALGIGTVGAGKAAIGAIQAKRIAERVAPLLLSDDPKVIARLSKLADKDPGFARVMENVGAAVSTAQMRPERVYEKDNQPAPGQRFAGGRVGRATGGRTGKNPKMKAESLIALANKIKKEEGQNTSSFLNLDDTTVAKALELANKHI